MRNLKRALSLTLASVMLLGMMVVGSSAAAGYDDVSETDNVEAIEVLQAIEVMVGDERGFGPERPVNRAEMAVVMGKLLSLDYNYYSTSCPFNDVYDWAQGWVGACAANGIVSGRGEGVYDPGATVTAVEAASMLMRALGYFKYSNDYADGFEVSTVRQGTIIGIFDGVGSSATEPMTRNQVAQMVLNALQSAVVEPDGNTTTFLNPDGTVLATTGKVNYVSVTSNKTFASAISRTQATSVGSQNDGWIVELGERLYDGKLKLTDTTDAFGRPSRYWEYDAKEIGTYVKEELIREEYTAKVTGRTLHDLLGSTVLKDYDLDVYIDGEDDPSINTNLFDARHLVRTNDVAVGGTGNGVLTQVFVDPDEGSNGLITIAIINTYLAIADEDFDDRTDSLDITVYGINEITKDHYVKNADNDDGSSNNQKEGFTLETEDFASIVDAKDGDAYLVNVAQGEVQIIADPEIMTDSQISSFKVGSWIVSGGTQYSFASAAEFECETLYDWTQYDGNGVVNLKDITYNIYLDKYGYAVGVEEVERVNNYVFITGVDTNTNNRFATQADASGIFLDGTMESMKIDLQAARELNDDSRTYNALTKVNSEKGSSLINKWFTYTVDDNGVYTVSLVLDSDAIDNNRARAAQFRTLTKDDNERVTENYHVTGEVVGLGATHGVNTVEGPKSIALRGNASPNNQWYSVYGDDESIYIVAELKTINHTKSNEVVNVIGGVDSVIVGIDNTNIEVWDYNKAMTADLGAVNDTAYGTYTLFDKDGDVIAAVVVGEDAGTVTNLVYTHKGMNSETDNNASGSTTRANGVKGTYTWTRYVIAEGEETLLTEVGSGLSKIGSMKRYTWYVVKYNSNGEVKSVCEAWATENQNFKGLIDADAKNVLDDVKRLEDRYVNNIEELNRATNENGTVLYEVGQYNSTDNTDLRVGNIPLLTTKPSVDNHTFYITTDTNAGVHRGFRVADDVKTVFIQTVNNDEQTTYETTYSGLEKVVGRLHEKAETNRSRWANPDTYHYEVSAVMKNGKAAVVVIRDLNNAGAVIDGVSRNYNLKLYGNLFTSPTTVTGASNAVVVVNGKEVAPTGIGVDTWGNYTTYSIPQGATVGITDYDIDNTDPAFTYLTNILSYSETGVANPYNLLVRYLNRSITFTMPAYETWIDGGRMNKDGTSPFRENITGETADNEPSLKEVEVTFAGQGEGVPLGLKSYGDPIQIVISNKTPAGRAAEIPALKAGDKYVVTLGDPQIKVNATVNASNQISFTYYLSGADIRNGEVVVYSIVASSTGSTTPTDPSKPVAVTGVSLDKSTASIAVNGTETLTATVTPDNATNKNVTWDSDDKTVATVSNGVVTGVKAGTATITVTTEDGSKTATCTVTVTSGSTPTPGTEGTQSFYAEKNADGTYTLYNFGDTTPSESAVKEAIAAVAGEGVTAADVQIINDGTAVLVKGTSANIVNSNNDASNVSTPEALAKITVGTKTLYAPAIAGSTVKGLDANTNYLFKGTKATGTFNAAADADGEATGVALNTANDKTYELVKALTLTNKEAGSGNIIQWNDGNNWVDFTDGTLKFQSTLPIRVKIAAAGVTANVPILITANGKVYTVTPTTQADTYVTLTDVPEVADGTVTVAIDSSSGTVYLNGTQYKDGTKEYFKAGDLIPVAAGTDYVVGLCGTKCTDAMFMTVAGQRYYVIQDGDIDDGKMSLNAAAAFTTQTNATLNKIAKDGVENATPGNPAYVAVGATVTVEAKAVYTVLESTLTGWKSENAGAWTGSAKGKWSFTMPADGVDKADAVKVAYSLTAPDSDAVNTLIQTLETADKTANIVVSGTGLSGKTLSAGWKTGATTIANVTIGTPESISTSVSIPVSVGATAMADNATSTITLKVGDLVLDIEVKGSQA